MRTTRLGAAVTGLGVLAVLAWTFLPILWVVMASLKEDRLQFAIPPVFVFEPTLRHYLSIFRDPEFSRFYLNSFVIAAVVTLAVLIMGVLAAYAHSHLRFPGRGYSMAFLVGIRAMPPVAVVVPLFLFYRALRLMDTYHGMALLYTAFFISFAVLMLKTFFDEVPREIEEAAAIDGCSPLQRLLLAHLPLIAPGLAATAVLAFVTSWNEFFFAFIFTSRAARTVPVALAMFVGETGISWGAMAAGATLVMLPSLVLAWLVQRHLVHGLTVGTLK